MEHMEPTHDPFTNVIGFLALVAFAVIMCNLTLGAITSNLTINQGGRMNKEEIMENLCCYDERSPDYGDLLISNGGDPQELPQPRIDCGCDNCFYGRDRLAVDLLDQ